MLLNTQNRGYRLKAAHCLHAPMGSQSFIGSLLLFLSGNEQSVKCLRLADHRSAVKEDRERCLGSRPGNALAPSPKQFFAYPIWIRQNPPF